MAGDLEQCTWRGGQTISIEGSDARPPLPDHASRQALSRSIARSSGDSIDWLGLDATPPPSEALGSGAAPVFDPSIRACRMENAPEP